MAQIEKDASLGLEINRALQQKDGDRLVEAVAAYMKHFGMTASHSALLLLPVESTN
ncbi:MAG: hypothetical protein AAGF28_07545 [Pseudomonadota bacterium]